ncbi:MAG TPA: hypothetical protein VE057_29020 [Archangium sp.]|nr:hypothetical protein [Archangium sp.]
MINDNNPKSPRISIATYRAKPGQEATLEKLVAQHIPTLRRLDLITERPAILCRAEDGTFIEVFEWRSAEAVDRAHHHPELGKIWEGMGTIGDFPPLSTIEECQARFPNFYPVTLK